MAESNNMKRIMLALGSLKTTRLFRNNVALAWVGQIVKRTPTTITLANYRPLHAGLSKGSSDLVGWHTVEVTPDMVGKRIAMFTAIEVKDNGGRISVEQVAFIQTVRQFGGIAGIAHNPEEALNIIENQPKLL